MYRIDNNFFVVKLGMINEKGVVIETLLSHNNNFHRGN